MRDAAIVDAQPHQLAIGRAIVWPPIPETSRESQKVDLIFCNGKVAQQIGCVCDGNIAQ